MARFTKSGGEAMSVAVRIARTYKKKIKFYSVDTMVGMIGIYPLILKIQIN